MHAWATPAPGRLPGRGGPVLLHDTATSSFRPAATGSAVRMYVCGITPYDATHLGHAATYVAFDVLNRVLRDSRLDVRYVQNVTDVDDPLLERAVQTGQGWQALAEEQTHLFRDDMAWLRVLPPDHFVGAVESIPQVVELIERLRSAGAAYELDGDLYFPVQADRHFGEISGLRRATMLELFAERGGDPDRPGKKDPLDCLLWQRGRPGEPAWEGPLGAGRPGWHVECAAIALSMLGDSIDIQGGGADLVFPHHEMSAAEAHVVTGRWPFAHAYVHAGLVGLGGEKMSKSRGNLVFVSQLRADGVEPAAVRLALLADHYRSDRDWTRALLATGYDRLARWREVVAADSAPSADTVVADVRRHLADDLDTPGALAVIDRWAEQALTTGGNDRAAPGRMRVLADALLGVELTAG
ncbi:MAG: cysteine--1-D-myo-inosityl 2-amino-2-deoxy-alpha-D-glucopyranoside ligase [Jiangellaceae bacterium]